MTTMLNHMCHNQAEVRGRAAIVVRGPGCQVLLWFEGSMHDGTLKSMRPRGIQDRPRRNLKVRTLWRKSNKFQVPSEALNLRQSLLGKVLKRVVIARMAETSAIRQLWRPTRRPAPPKREATNAHPTGAFMAKRLRPGPRTRNTLAIRYEAMRVLCACAPLGRLGKLGQARPPRGGLHPRCDTTRGSGGCQARGPERRGARGPGRRRPL